MIKLANLFFPSEVISFRIFFHCKKNKILRNLNGYLSTCHIHQMFNLVPQRVDPETDALVYDTGSIKFSNFNLT